MLMLMRWIYRCWYDAKAQVEAERRRKFDEHHRKVWEAGLDE